MYIFFSKFPEYEVIFAITGHFPDGQFPDGQFPDGHFPDGHFPEWKIPRPDNSQPGHFPERRFPDHTIIFVMLNETE